MSKKQSRDSDVSVAESPSGAAPSRPPESRRYVLTPGLTPKQRLRLSDALRRIADLRTSAHSSIAQVYLDADIAAARALNPLADYTVPCSVLAASIAAEHRIPVDLAACAYGIAVGVRLGKTFAPAPPPRKKWISEEYKRLTEPNRRDVQRYIRRVLKIQLQGRTPYAMRVTGGERKPKWWNK